MAQAVTAAPELTESQDRIGKPRWYYDARAKAQPWHLFPSGIIAIVRSDAEWGAVYGLEWSAYAAFQQARDDGMDVSVKRVLKEHCKTSDEALALVRGWLARETVR